MQQAVTHHCRLGQRHLAQLTLRRMTNFRIVLSFHVSGLLIAILVASASLASAESDQAAGFLTFESVSDGHCQNLSEGGKLRILRNHHTSRAIQFRLLRVFADKPQGLSSGVAPIDGAPVKLGCTRVDGREQNWVIERARFESVQEN